MEFWVETASDNKEQHSKMKNAAILLIFSLGFFSGLFVGMIGMLK